MQNRPKENRGVWIAFLVMCFALTGLVGIFASYSTSIPLDRALYRSAALDVALSANPPDPAAIRAVLGDQADSLLNGPGDLATRAASARASIRAEAETESASVGGRTRLMIAVVTILAAAIGSGILMIVSKAAQPGTPNSLR